MLMSTLLLLCSCKNTTDEYLTKFVCIEGTESVYYTSQYNVQTGSVDMVPNYDCEYEKHVYKNPNYIKPTEKVGE